MIPAATACASDPEARRPLAVPLLVLLALAASAAGLVAQEPAPAEGEAGEKKEEAAEEGEAPEVGDSPAEAFFFGRVFPVSGPPIDDAVIVVRGGRIAAIGPRSEVEIPYAARRVELPGRVATPGFVHPGTIAFSGAERVALGGTATRCDHLAASRLDPDAAGLREFARAGFTKIVCVPTGGGLAGMAAVIEPVARRRGPVAIADCLAVEQAFLMSAFEPGTATKDSWKKNLEKARQYLDELAKWKEAQGRGGAAAPATEEKKDPPAGEAAKPEAEKKEGEAKPAGQAAGAAAKPEPPKEPVRDPKLAPLAEHLDGRRAMVLALADAPAFLHFHPNFEAEAGLRPALFLVPPNRRDGLDIWRMADRIASLGLAVVLPPVLTREPLSPAARFPARELLDRGILVAFVPDGEGAVPLRRFRTLLQEAARLGVDEESVLQAVTLAPARILGLAERTGSLEVGKDADFLVFSGDPLRPTSGLLAVYVRGRAVLEETEPQP
jgi:hypothetical protein